MILDEGLILFGLSHTEIALVSLCVKYLAGQGAPCLSTASILIKLRDGAADNIEPNDVMLELTEEEATEVGLAVSLTLGDSLMARDVPPADVPIEGFRLSELAQFIPTMRDISRRLDVALQLAEQEQQIADLCARIAKLEASQAKRR